MTFQLRIKLCATQNAVGKIRHLLGENKLYILLYTQMKDSSA